jgi:periplasmic divalent cation tolerance protein
MKILLCYTTFPNRVVAQDICNLLISQKNIACANYGDIQSMYMWENTLCTETEISCLLKTQTLLRDELESLLKKYHPYKTPALLFIEVETSLEYGSWVYEMTKKD